MIFLMRNPRRSSRWVSLRKNEVMVKKMKMPETIRTYCPYCKTHTKQKIKVVRKGKESAFSWGARQHRRKLKGYIGKLAGKKTVKKRGKSQKVTLECTICKKKTERIIGTRTAKPLELTKL